MHKIEVRLKTHLPDPAGRGLVKDIQDLGINSVSDVRVVEIYWLDAFLAPEKVENLCRICWLTNLDIVFRTKLQESFRSGGGVLRALALITVRQHKRKSGCKAPFYLSGGDELVDKDLCSVGKVAELGFPDNEGVGGGDGVAVFEAEDGLFGKYGVDHGKGCLVVGDVLQGDIAA